jgi:hypothetical protein
MAQEAAAGLVGKQWENIVDLIIEANRVLKEQESISSNKRIKALGATPKESAKLIADAEEIASRARLTYEDTIKKINDMKPVATVVAAPVATTKEVAAAAPVGERVSYSMGIPIRYAAGGIAGTGGRDSIPSMLTPGEFVMRKASVQKYGSSMFERMNMGAFNMPKYDIEGGSISQPTSAVSTSTSINAPVYNTYSVNVNVPNTNADPSMIADKVIMRMNQIDNANIRSVRGNK